MIRPAPARMRGKPKPEGHRLPETLVAGTQIALGRMERSVS
jgi:hypothetical protein